MSTEEIDYLSVEDLLEIAAGVIDRLVVRDAGLLAAAAALPRVTVFGDDAYPTFDDKSAALLHSLVRNHALVDGNKRFAWSATRVFCLLNGRDLTHTVDEAEDLMLSATSGQLDVPQIATWIVAHSSSASSRPRKGLWRPLDRTNSAVPDPPGVRVGSPLRVGSGSGVDLAGEPGAGVDPLAASSAAPPVVDVEGGVGDGLGPLPPQERLADRPVLPRVAPRDGVVAEPARPDDGGCTAVGDRVGGVVGQPCLVDAEGVPVGVDPGVAAAAQVAPRAGHVPRGGGAGAEGAERADLPAEFADDVVDAAVLVDRRDDVCTSAAVLAIEAEAAGPVRVAAGSLAVAPAEQDAPGGRSAADGAARELELVVARLVAGASGPEVVPAHVRAPLRADRGAGRRSTGPDRAR